MKLTRPKLPASTQKALLKYNKEMVGKGVTSEEFAEYAGKFNDAMSGVLVSRPTDMDWGASLSQVWNNFCDWVTYYWSDAKDVVTFGDATEKLRSPKKMNEYLRHNYQYEYDVDEDDEFRDPEEVFNHRDADGIYEGMIRDDCDGAASLTQYCVAKSRGLGMDEIVRKYEEEGVADVMILCIYNDAEGHATCVFTEGGEYETCCNFGRIRHGKKAELKNLPAVGKNFIEDANTYSLAVNSDDGTDVVFLEGGEAGTFETGEGFRITAKDVEKMAEAGCASVRGSEVRFNIDKLRERGYDAEKVVSFFEKEFKHEGAGARMLSRKLNVPKKAMARLSRFAVA